MISNILNLPGTLGGSILKGVFDPVVKGTALVNPNIPDSATFPVTSFLAIEFSSGRVVLELKIKRWPFIIN